jgi:hypothetical protein
MSKSITWTPVAGMNSGRGGSLWVMTYRDIGRVGPLRSRLAI